MIGSLFCLLAMDYHRYIYNSCDFDANIMVKCRTWAFINAWVMDKITVWRIYTTVPSFFLHDVLVDALLPQCCRKQPCRSIYMPFKRYLVTNRVLLINCLSHLMTVSHLSGRVAQINAKWYVPSCLPFRVLVNISSKDNDPGYSVKNDPSLF